jgi:sec-independent protein translocase protein TatA
MPNIGPLEIGIVLIIALIVFGPKKLPELGNSLGKGIREFKGSISGEHANEENVEESKPAAIVASSATPAVESTSNVSAAVPAREKQHA